MFRKSHIDRRIRESFESLNQQAPEKTWENISGEIENKALKHMDAQIKNSFESIYRHAPDHVWSNINRQLYLDRTWKRIRKALDKRTLLRRAGKTAALLLLFALFGLTVYRLGNQMIQQPLSSYHQAMQAVSTSHPSDKKTHQHRTVPLANKRQALALSGANTSASYDTMLSDVVSYHEQTKDKPHAPSGINHRNRLTGPSRVHTTAEHSNPYIPFMQPKPVRSIASSSMKKSLIEDCTQSSEPYYRNDVSGLFAFGFTGSIHNTWLMNNETRRSFNQNSLISTSAYFSGNYGITGDYYLSAKNGLEMILFLHSDIGEIYQIYSEGKYIAKKASLIYREIALLYQHSIRLQTSNRTSIYLFKAGPFFSVLRRAGIEQGGYFTEAKNRYAETDAGLMLQCVREVSRGHVALQYGFIAEKGVPNIFKGEGKIPADFNYTTTLKIGACLNLQYRP